MLKKCDKKDCIYFKGENKMKDIKTIASYGNDTIYHVISESGNSIIYDYFVYQNEEDFCFMPCESTFRFPQRLNFYDIPKITVNFYDIPKITDSAEMLKLAEIEKCNSETLKECISTMYLLLNEDK